LKARYRTALEAAAAEAAFSEQFHDAAPIERYVRSRALLAQAALALCQTQQQRVAIMQDRLEVCREVERYVEEQFRNGALPARDYHRVRYERIDAEIQWLEASRAGGTSNSNSSTANND
jgi:hypothetical protein